VTIEQYEPVELASADLPRWAKLLAVTSQLADVIAATEFVPTPMRGKPEAITATILYGDELGIGPMQSLASIAIVEGKPSPSAELVRGLIYAAGGELAYRELTDTRVTVEGRRAGARSSTSVTWTIDQARRAGLAGRKAWRDYPRAMLAARATAELARLVWPDVVRGLADTAEPLETDEAAAPSTDGAEPVSATATVRRRRRSVATTAASADPPASLPPSPTPEDAEEPPAAASAEQLMRLNISLRQLVNEDRAAKLRVVSHIIGRDVASSKELTWDEASTAIDAAEGMVAGTVELPPVEPITGDEPEPVDEPTPDEP
jgi:hypothetical protein